MGLRVVVSPPVDAQEPGNFDFNMIIKGFFMPTAILAEAYCFRRVLKNLACFEKCFLCFLCLKILHRTQIC